MTPLSKTRFKFWVFGLIILAGCKATKSNSENFDSDLQTEKSNDQNELSDKTKYSKLESYLNKHNAIGMSIDDFWGQIGIHAPQYTEVPGSLPSTARNRLYHFDGFYVFVTVNTVVREGRFTGKLIEGLHERNEVEVWGFHPYVHADGLTDPKERTENATKKFFSSRKIGTSNNDE